MGERLRYAKELLKAFRLERFTYVGISVASFGILAAALIRMIFAGSPNYSAVLTAFGSSGAVAFTGGRVLAMWNRVFGFVIGSESGATKGHEARTT